jgi:hypothetical protein
MQLLSLPDWLAFAPWAYGETRGLKLGCMKQQPVLLTLLKQIGRQEVKSKGRHRLLKASNFVNNKIKNYSTFSNNLKSYTINNPFFNRKLIAEYAKNKKGIYIFKIVKKNLYYVGSSINLYSRVCSYFMPSILTKADRRVLRYLNKYGFKDVSLSLYILEDKASIEELLY